MKAFEKFIHTNCKDKFLWAGRRFSGYSETYNSKIDLKIWYGYFKHGLPELKEEMTTDQLNNYINY